MFMLVIPRHVCREIKHALAFEWFVRNGKGGYAAASLGGALTRRQHGLLVAPLPDAETPYVLLTKLDEEVEVEGHLFKLGTNEYQTNILNPDGFLYLQQVVQEGGLTRFTYEAGRFHLTKSVWMAPERATTYIHYRLAEYSAPAQLTLVPMCDYRSVNDVTTGSESRHFQIQIVEHGLRVTAFEGATPYTLLTAPRANFTPLDLWYWRFQLRADANAATDLYVPGLVRISLDPGATFLLAASIEADATADIDVDAAMLEARQRDLKADTGALPFAPALYSAP
jgi:predicted glycogen debranching enzyme